MKSEPNILNYRIAKWASRAFILVGPGAFLVFLEYMSFRDLPTWVMFVPLILAYGGYKASGVIEAWEWEAVGRPVGLTPIEGDSRRDELSENMDSKSTPILTGHVGGRLVRALSVTESQGAGQGSRTATIIETDLRHPPDAGVIVEPVDSGFLNELLESAPEEVEIYKEASDVSGPRFVAVGDPPELAGTVLSGRSRDAVSAIQPFHRLLVGDAERVLPDWQEKSVDIPLLGSALDRGIESLMNEQVRGDAQTVTHYLADETIRDPDVLKQHVESVVAVAEAFEEATL